MRGLNEAIAVESLAKGSKRSNFGMKIFFTGGIVLNSFIGYVALDRQVRESHASCTLAFVL